MTTVIIDYEEQRVYADKVGTVYRDNSNTLMERLFIGSSPIDEVVSFTKTQDKIRRTCGGYLLTGAGCSRTMEMFYDWPHRIPPTPKNKTTVIILVPCGHTTRQITYTCSGQRKWWKPREKWKQKVEVRSKGYYCIGSGQDFATGAMYSGANPSEAIVAASHADISTGNEIDQVSYKEGGDEEDMALS